MYEYYILALRDIYNLSVTFDISIFKLTIIIGDRDNKKPKVTTNLQYWPNMMAEVL